MLQNGITTRYTLLNKEQIKSELHDQTKFALFIIPVHNDACFESVSTNLSYFCQLAIN